MFLQVVKSFAVTGLLLGQTLLAQAQSVDDQMLHAVQTFRPWGEFKNYNHAHSFLLKDAAGKWLEAGDAFLDRATGKFDQDAFAYGCTNNGFDLSVSKFQFRITKDITRKDGSKVKYEAVYSDHGGGIYGFMIDPIGLLARYGYEEAKDEMGVADQFRSLRLASDVARVYRPSPSVLVILQNNTQPEFWIRCP